MDGLLTADALSDINRQPIIKYKIEKRKFKLTVEEK